ncbi:CVNH domain-containing protein [Colletotrichum graminicola]|nr:CVNH domain-containing protein [Colletotrichum graminicola]
MKPIAIFSAIPTSLFAALAIADRQCPLESDCIQRLCTDFNYSIESAREKGFMMEASCKNAAGVHIFSKLNLKKCVANRDGILQWAPDGDFRCSRCRLYETGPDDYIGLQCDFCPTRNFFWAHKWTWINLSYGIWVSKNGALSCYSHEGEYRPSS